MHLPLFGKSVSNDESSVNLYRSGSQATTEYKPPPDHVTVIETALAYLDSGQNTVKTG